MCMTHGHELWWQGVEVGGDVEGSGVMQRRGKKREKNRTSVIE